MSAKTREYVLKAFNDLITVIHHRNIQILQENYVKDFVKVTTKQLKCVCS